MEDLLSELKQCFWMNIEVNLKGIWMTHKTWHSVKKKEEKRGRKWCTVFNHWPCVISCLWQSKPSAVKWMLWFFLYVLQVWLLHLSEYASSTVPQTSWIRCSSLSSEARELSWLSSALRDAPFSTVCVMRTLILACAAFTVAHAGECMGYWHLLRCPMPCDSDLTWTYLTLTHYSGRGFQIGHLTNWPPCKPGLKKM